MLYYGFYSILVSEGHLDSYTLTNY